MQNQRHFRPIKRERIPRLDVTPGAIPASDAAFIRAVSTAVEVLFGRRWKSEILCVLLGGPVRFGQLARRLPKASKKVLTQNLRQLEIDGVIARIDKSDYVLHVEYELAQDLRETVIALLDHAAQWGGRYLARSASRADEELADEP